MMEVRRGGRGGGRTEVGWGMNRTRRNKKRVRGRVCVCVCVCRYENKKKLGFSKHV